MTLFLEGPILNIIHLTLSSVGRLQNPPRPPQQVPTLVLEIITAALPVKLQGIIMKLIPKAPPPLDIRPVSASVPAQPSRAKRDTHPVQHLRAPVDLTRQP